MPTETLLTVTNEAPTQPVPPGLVERVRLVGGTLHYGPDGAGFQVTARLPHRSGAAPAPSEARFVQSESASELANAGRGPVGVLSWPSRLRWGWGSVSVR
ncbi:MAG: hypothetical protein ACRDTF_02755 [Pseudonocardiaceae bacterium]